MKKTYEDGLKEALKMHIEALHASSRKSVKANTAPKVEQALAKQIAVRVDKRGIPFSHQTIVPAGGA